MNTQQAALQLPGLPKLSCIGHWIFEDIAKGRKATDAHLAALSLLFDKQVTKAAQIVDVHGVSSYEGKDSGRVVYQVRSKDGAPYTVFPGHYCSCHSFFYDIVSKEEGIYCKHQLAAYLSDALGRTKKNKVPDQVVAEILESY